MENLFVKFVWLSIIVIFAYTVLIKKVNLIIIINIIKFVLHVIQQNFVHCVKIHYLMHYLLN